MHGKRSRRQGFSLLDLVAILVVSALLILGIGLWLIKRPPSHPPRHSVFLHSLDAACRVYAIDYRQQFPPSRDPAWGLEGRYLLCQLLTGYAPASEPKDGVEGYGYRLANGRLVSPLVDVDKLRVAPGPGNSAVFRDPFGNDVYYYCASQEWYQYRTGLSTDPPSTPPFDGSHNTGGPADVNGYVRNTAGGSPPFLTEDILLCTKGPDGIWGSKDPKDGVVRQNYCDFRDVDDLTNFLGD